jgi:predicted XRE-type DNA-binding protein
MLRAKIKARIQLFVISKIARAVGLSESRVSQIHARALAILEEDAMLAGDRWRTGS